MKQLSQKTNTQTQDHGKATTSLIVVIVLAILSLEASLVLTSSWTSDHLLRGLERLGWLSRGFN